MLATIATIAATATIAGRRGMCELREKDPVARRLSGNLMRHHQGRNRHRHGGPGLGSAAAHHAPFEPVRDGATPTSASRRLASRAECRRNLSSMLAKLGHRLRPVLALLFQTSHHDALERLRNRQLRALRRRLRCSLEVRHGHGHGVRLIEDDRSGQQVSKLRSRARRCRRGVDIGFPAHLFRRHEGRSSARLA